MIHVGGLFSRSMTSTGRPGGVLARPGGPAGLCKAPSTSWWPFMAATRCRRHAPYCACVSFHGVLGTLVMSPFRIQATVVSCRSTSAQSPGCSWASSPQKSSSSVGSSAAASSAATRPVTVLKKARPRSSWPAGGLICGPAVRTAGRPTGRWRWGNTSSKF